jgi:hypothetical protein
VRSEKSEVKLACWERGLTRRREGLEGRGLGEGLVGRVGRRTPCAGRAVILTAVQSLRLLVRRGACWVARVRSLAIPGAGWERAGRRTPCAGRAVILTAVQSLRLLVRRTPSWGSELPGACGERGLFGRRHGEGRG